MAEPAILDIFKGARIVATLPQLADNGGWPHRLALQQIAAMRALGAEVFPFDVGYSATGDMSALYRQVSQLAEFKPEVVVSTPGVMQVLRCRTGNLVARDGWYVPNNLFVDNLGLPTIMMWDTMAVFFNAMRVVSLDPKESRAGMLVALREQINHPLYYHCPVDQQHVDCLQALGVLTTANVRARLSHAYPQYVAYGKANAPQRHDGKIVFTGNLFSPAPQFATEKRVQATLDRFREAVLRRFRADIGTSYWAAVESALAELDEADAREAKLAYDESFFWTFLAADVVARVITENRVGAFTASRSPIDVYGLMHSPESVSMLDDYPHLTYKGVADFDTGMPPLYARSAIALDMVAAHFPTGVTAKILGCFAAGGLCVFNRKTAFAESFGEIGEHVMFRDYDDMNAKIEWLLTHEAQRRELAAALQAHTLRNHIFVKTVAENLAWVRSGRPD